MNDLPPIQSFEDFEREVAPSAPPTELERLAAERAALLGRVRRGIRSRHQERILRRVAEFTREIPTFGGA